MAALKTLQLMEVFSSVEIVGVFAHRSWHLGCAENVAAQGGWCRVDGKLLTVGVRISEDKRTSPSLLSVSYGR